MLTFVKRNPAAPPGFFACEAAGLQWLSCANGASVARVVACDGTSLTLERLQSGRPKREHAHAFGHALATTHDAGSREWGAPPDGWSGPGYFGPLHQPLPMSYTPQDTWGQFYAAQRLRPMLERAAHQLGAEATALVEHVIERCAAGAFDDGETPARLHGDLWSGNLMWTPDGVVLIDPAAHGGHRETDLAMLDLFGCPHLDAIIAGYQEVHPLTPGWRDRVPLHQLYPLLAHVVLFGTGYAQATAAAAELVGGSN